MRAVLFLLCLLISTPALQAAEKIATLILLSKSVQVIRDGRMLEVRSQETALYNDDQLETSAAGKAKILFENGDIGYLGPNSTLDIHTEKTSMVTKVSLKLSGKLRSLVNHRARRSFRVRTVNAVIGVKGTDFITESSGDQTRVGTLKGLVSLSSNLTGGTIDVPAGKQGAVNISGKIMPLTEIAGDILDGVEIGGRQLDLEESAGHKVSP